MTEHIGGRVRVWRRRRGLSQAALAGFADLSQAYVSQIESGTRGVERRSTLVALATALNVSVADLLGQSSDPTDPARIRASEAVAAVRVALVELEVGDIRPPRRSRDEMASAVEHAMGLRQASDYLALAPLLPDLLRDAAGHPESDALTRIGYEASVCLRNLGYRDLSWPAAKIAVKSARELDSPAWTGAANFIYALSLPFEAAPIARKISESSLSDLQANSADPNARQMLGQVHLSAAFASAVAKDTANAQAHLDEAAKEARTLGDPDGPGFNLSFFGPTNVRLWRMAICTELAEYGKVIELADGLPVNQLPVANRQQSYHLNLARALAHSGKHDKEALFSFARAERAAPAPFRLNPIARDAISTMIRRAQKKSVAEDLMSMARRLGIDPRIASSN